MRVTRCAPWLARRFPDAVHLQGAWGASPAQINELSPGPLRGFFPGFAYEVGVLIASSAPPIEARMAEHFTYAQSMGMFAAAACAVGALVVAFGPEAHRVSFGPASKSAA